MNNPKSFYFHALDLCEKPLSILLTLPLVITWISNLQMESTSPLLTSTFQKKISNVKFVQLEYDLSSTFCPKNSKQFGTPTSKWFPFWNFKDSPLLHFPTVKCVWVSTHSSILHPLLCPNFNHKPKVNVETQFGS